MAKKIIITIARQYGSGGREIGERLAKLLDIPLYDKELITEAATKGNLNEEVIKATEESAANSLLYTLAMGSNIAGAGPHFGYRMPINDKLFILQSEVIKEYASRGSAVIIGRCADYVLREEENLFRIFIYGDLEHRKARVAERHPEVKSSAIVDLISKTDKRRANYYSYYTGDKWGKADKYDLVVSTSTIGVHGAAELIYNYLKMLDAKEQ